MTASGLPDDRRSRELAQGVRAARQRVADACVSAGRDPGEVELLVVTKFFPADDVRRLIGLGERAFGESREPEASRKVAEIGTEATAGCRFDMIGSLQRNKAKAVARWAHRVHSVDSVRLARALDQGARVALDSGHRAGPLEALIQVSVDGDVSRGGIDSADVPELAAEIATARCLRLAGMMVIAPLHGDVDDWMARAARCYAGLLEQHPGALVFSAGMSGDIEPAIRHGSTCVRVGTAIMGPRPIRSP